MRILNTLDGWRQKLWSNPQLTNAYLNIRGNNGAKDTAVAGAILGGVVALFRGHEGNKLVNVIKAAVTWGLIGFVASRVGEVFHPPAATAVP